MSEEQNTVIETKKEHQCFCQSKGFRKFLVTALGTFVGVYAALSLFAALHRPPMMLPQPFGFQGGMRNGCPCKMIHHHQHHMNKAQKFSKEEFQRREKGHNNPAPFEADRED